ncbi:MAG TPA: hypothetical protein DGG95_13455 [Cytophagales bacterium]|jgi:hypothetical protein|nr:hypothetical protein [Cytophagales bacterium]
MRYFSFILILVASFSCVDPYLLSTVEYRPAIVVEGMITDQPGPYLVKISETASINDQSGAFILITGAIVTIRDDKGNDEVLIEKSTGNYYTQTLQGVVGQTYTLSITTSDGYTYESVPEKLLPVGDFSNLHGEFVQKEDPAKSRQITSKNGFDVYLDSDVLQDQGERVWWRWTGTYEIATLPQLNVSLITGAKGVLDIEPDPPYCSGYVLGPLYGEYGGPMVVKGPFEPCTCCTCWVTEYSSTVIISNPNFVSDNKVNHQLIGFVEANVRTMYNKYYLLVEQLSVSQAVYDFWKQVKSQKSNSSNLFQTPPPKTTGNIFAKSEGAIPALGYFAASSINTHVLVLNKSMVPYPMPPIDTITTSCLEVNYKNITNIKPLFW